MNEPKAAETEEIEIFSTDEGRKLALKAKQEKEDPFPKIPASLLSADDIDRYVRSTGLIAPYHRGGKNDRLKKAAYEGRIGNYAYKYNEHGKLVPILTKGKGLTVPANTIVFVETNLEFRLPDYIALRFNMAITHVHRGLLLGTGPLIDPGYWGKLCIPLHNLTNLPYEIPANEGLIWVEFTKTTSTPSKGRDPVLSVAKAEEDPNNPGAWNITKFIEKAAKQFGPEENSVAIRSSIPLVAEEAAQKATLAADEASSAKDDASKSRKYSEEAKASAEQIKSKVESYGIIALLVSIATAFGIWASFYFGLRADLATLSARIDSAVEASSKVEDTPAKGNPRRLSNEERLKSDVDNLRNRLDEMARQNFALKKQVEELSGRSPP
jgi:deoxycytidine triphosphate deaminase